MKPTFPTHPSTSGAVHVSDHALVRWLERNNIVDIQQLRDALAASLGTACGAADLMNVNEYAIRRDGWKYIVRDHTLVTIFPVKDRDARRRKQRYHEELA